MQPQQQTVNASTDGIGTGIRSLYRHDRDLQLYGNVDVISTTESDQWINRYELATDSNELPLGGFGVVFIAVILWMFSFSTFLGILFYARSNVAYLFGDKWGWQTAYKVLALVMLFIGGIQTYTFVWDLGDVGIGLMTIFNIFILYAMSGQAIKELKNYEETKKKSIEERAYALQEDE